MAADEWPWAMLAAKRIGEARLLPLWREGALRSVPMKTIVQKANRIGEAALNQELHKETLPLRGVKRGTDEEGDIPSPVAARLTLVCANNVLARRSSRGWRSPLVEYTGVKVQPAAVERLAQEATTPVREQTAAGSRRPYAGAMLREGFVAPGRRTQSRIGLGRIDLPGAGAAPARKEEAVPAAANRPVSEAISEQSPQNAAGTPVMEAPSNQPQADVEQVTQEAGTTASKPKQEDEVAAALFKEWPDGRPRGMKVKDLLIVLQDRDRHPDLGTFGTSTLERAIRKAKKMGWSYQTDRQLPSDGD